MTTIAVFGGTGYAGGHIVREAARRGHAVTSVSRRGAAEPLDGVTQLQGSVHDPDLVGRLAEDHDVVVVAVPAHASALRDALPDLTRAVAKHHARLGVVGGAGSLHVAPGGPRVVDTPEFPEQFKAEALDHAAVLDELRATDPDVDWFYLSPAAVFGAHVPGRATGAYRTAGDVLVTTASGESEISGDDYALAFVDEIDRPEHRRERFAVGH